MYVWVHSDQTDVKRWHASTVSESGLYVTTSKEETCNMKGRKGRFFKQKRENTTISLPLQLVCTLVSTYELGVVSNQERLLYRVYPRRSGGNPPPPPPPPPLKCTESNFDSMTCDPTPLGAHKVASKNVIPNLINLVKKWNLS